MSGFVVALTKAKRRLLAKEVRRRRRARERLQGGCVRHERDRMVTLFDESNGTNPAKHIGYFCRACVTVFTPTGAASQPVVPSLPKVPSAPLRASRSHATRVRAVDRLGLAIAVEERVA